VLILEEDQLKNIIKRKIMAKMASFVFRGTNSKKRRGVHSKNASKSQNSYKKPYRGQGR